MVLVVKAASPTIKTVVVDVMGITIGPTGYVPNAPAVAAGTFWKKVPIAPNVADVVEMPPWYSVGTVVPAGTKWAPPITSHTPGLSEIDVRFNAIPVVIGMAVGAAGVIACPMLPTAAAAPAPPTIFGVVMVELAGIEGAPQIGALDGPEDTIACPLVDPAGFSNWIGSSVAAWTETAKSARIASSFFMLKFLPG